MDILEEIQKQYTSFSSKEKDIATYILQKSSEIKNINISDLAKITGTSGATITRFCKKLNCANFVDMKIKLNGTSKSLTHTRNCEISDNIYSFYNKVINNTKKTLDNEVMKDVINSIKKANRIFIYGVGSSGLTSIELTQRLVRMGLNATSITDSHLMLINSAIALKGDLVIGISTSGETEDVVKALKISKQNKARVVSITSFSESEIAKLSDTSLLVYNSMFVDEERFINSQFAMIYVIDIISMMLLKDEKLSYNMKKTIEVIINDK